MLGSTYQANLQIMQTKSSVVIRHEIMHGVRIIPVDGSPHLAKNVRLLFGDSRGRWDGDVLLFEKKTPRGEARYEFRFGGDTYEFQIENRFPPQPDFMVFMRGHYRRER